jgi:hypothetical protein
MPAKPQRAKTQRAKAQRAKTQGDKTLSVKTKRWSATVTRNSNALDLEQGAFSLKDPGRIAASLERSARASRRRKSDPYRSAMSMLTFYARARRSWAPHG